MRDHPKIRLDESGNLWLNFEQYGQEVELAAFSGDGSRLATVHEVDKACIFDTATGEMISQITPSSHLSGTKFGTTDFQLFIEAVAFDHKGELVLLGMNDGTAGVFDVATGKRLSTMCARDEGPPSDWELIRAVEFSPDGTLTIVGFFNNLIGIWNRTGEKLIARLAPEDGDRPASGSDWGRMTLISSVAISKDNKIAFAGAADMTVIVWDIEKKNQAFKAVEHTQQVLTVQFNGDDIYWATSRGVVVKQTKEGALERVMDACQSWEDADFAPDFKSIFCVTPQRECLEWTFNPLGSKKLESFESDSFDEERGIGRTANGRVYFAGHKAEKVIESPVGAVSLPGKSKFSCIFIGDKGPRYYDDEWSHTITVRSTVDGATVKIRTEGAIGSMALSPDGKRLAIGTLGMGGPGEDRFIEIWDLEKQERTHHWGAHTHQVLALSFGANAGTLVSASLDHTVRVWKLTEAPDWKVALVGSCHPSDLNPNNLSVLKDGRVIVLAADTFEAWSPDLKKRLSRGEIVARWRAKWAIDSDEKTLVLERGQQQFGQMDLNTGRLLRSFAPEFPRVRFIPSSERGKSIEAVAGVSVWELDWGVFAHNSDGPRGWETMLRPTEDGSHILIPCESKVVLLQMDESKSEELVEMPFSGRFRAGCVTESKILAVNSEGAVFVRKRS